MKDLLSIKRIAWVYGGIVALFVLLITYVPIKSFSPLMEEETAKLQEEEEDRIEEIARQENTVPGNVYDRNMTVLCEMNTDTDVYQYSNNLFYSNLLGKYEASDGLLLDRTDSVLKSTDGRSNRGDSLILTLDDELQNLVCQTLSVGQGERRGAVVLDAKTGAILAMGSYPFYDVTGELPDNRKITNPLLYPWRPGSIWKVITGVGVIESGWDNEVILDEGSFKLPTGGTIYDDGVKEKLSAGESVTPVNRVFDSAIEYSSNVYFGQMAYRMGWSLMEEIAGRFKIGVQGYGFEFGAMNSTFESSAEPYDKSMPNYDLAQIGYGYAGLQLTPLHAAMVTQAIANDGTMQMPYLVDEVITSLGANIGENSYRYEDGEVIDKEVPGSRKGEAVRVMDADTAAKIRNAMKAGYAHTKSAYELRNDPIPGLTQEGIMVNDKLYTIACKTGTADIYEDGRNCAWIISMAPADDPRYIVVVSRYEVPAKTYGNSVLGDVADIYRALFAEE